MEQQRERSRGQPWGICEIRESDGCERQGVRRDLFRCRCGVRFALQRQRPTGSCLRTELPRDGSATPMPYRSSPVAAFGDETKLVRPCLDSRFCSDNSKEEPSGNGTGCLGEGHGLPSCGPIFYAIEQENAQLKELPANAVMILEKPCRPVELN